MGLFDGLKRDKKVAETVKHSSEREDQEYEDEISIDHIEIVERDVTPVVEDVVVPKPIKSFKDKNPVRHVIGQTKVIAIINQKGGVGKTTTTVNLGACLANLGKKVLLIDIDAQGNATSGMGVPKPDVAHDVYDVLVNEEPITSVVQHTSRENLDIVPATIQLAGAEIELTSMMARESRLKLAIDEVRDMYDFVLIDCPPSLGHLTINAFTASDSILIPVQCEYYALEGLSQLLNTIRLVQKHFNPELKIEGVLLTMYDARTNLGAEVVEEVRKYFREKVYDTIIPRNVRLSEAPSHGLPIIDYDIRSKGAEVYQALAKEVLENE